MTLPITNPSLRRAAASPVIQASGQIVIPPQDMTHPLSNLSSDRSPPLLIDRVAPPEFVPGLARTCVDSCELTLRTRTEGATIYYAWNSTSASNLSAVYAKQIRVTASSTVAAVAYKPGLAPSEVLSSCV